jgi:hypothetical protein
MIGIWCAIAATAAAQTPPPESEPARDEFQPEHDSGHSLSLRLSGGYSPSAGISGGGDVSRGLVGAEAEFSTFISDNLTLNLGVSSTRAIYDFSGSNKLPGNGKPWGDVSYFNLSAGLSAELSNTWTVFGAFHALSAGEDSADFSETWTLGGVGGFTYKFSETLTVGLALAAQQRLEDDPFVVPFPMIDWVLPFDESGRWRLSVGGGSRAGIAATGAGISFAPSDQWTLSLGIGGIGLGGEFRLDENSPVPGGVARDNFATLSFGVDYSPTPTFTASAFAGVAFDGELEILDRNGKRVSRRDVETAPIFGLAISFAF